MADFRGLSERIRTVREQDAAEAEILAGRLDAYERKRPTVLARAHAHLDQKNTEMAALENDLNQLSNAFEGSDEDGPAPRPTPANGPVP